MPDTSETRAFKWVSLISSAFFVGIFLANLIYFGKIYTAGGNVSVSKGQALAMMWLNGILLVVALIIFIWSIFRLAITREARKGVSAYFNEEGGGYYGAPGERGAQPLPYIYPTRA